MNTLRVVASVFCAQYICPWLGSASRYTAHLILQLDKDGNSFRERYMLQLHGKIWLKILLITCQSQAVLERQDLQALSTSLGWERYDNACPRRLQKYGQRGVQWESCRRIRARQRRAQLQPTNIWQGHLTAYCSWLFAGSFVGPCRVLWLDIAF
jgi:hypothetical protein